MNIKLKYQKGDARVSSFIPPANILNSGEKKIVLKKQFNEIKPNTYLDLRSAEVNDQI